MGSRPITVADLDALLSETDAAWLAGFIVGDGSVCYSSKPKAGRRYFEARVRIGIYELEPVEKAAKLMGVSAFGPRGGRYETDAHGTRATAVISRILPHLSGRKAQEAAFILEHGSHVSLEVYLNFQELFSTGRRKQAALATPTDWKAISKANESLALSTACSGASGAPVEVESADCSPVNQARHGPIA